MLKRKDIQIVRMQTEYGIVVRAWAEINSSQTIVQEVIDSIKESDKERFFKHQEEDGAHTIFHEVYGEISYLLNELRYRVFALTGLRMVPDGEEIGPAPMYDPKIEELFNTLMDLTSHDVWAAVER